MLSQLYSSHVAHLVVPSAGNSNQGAFSRKKICDEGKGTKLDTSSSTDPAATAILVGSLFRVMVSVEPQRGQKPREAESLDCQIVGFFSQSIDSTGKAIQAWYGAPACLRHSVQ